MTLSGRQKNCDRSEFCHDFGIKLPVGHSAFSEFADAAVLTVIYHCLDPHGVVEAVRARYQRRFVLGKDLMMIHIGKGTTWQELSTEGR